MIPDIPRLMSATPFRSLTNFSLRFATVAPKLIAVNIEVIKQSRKPSEELPFADSSNMAKYTFKRLVQILIISRFFLILQNSSRAG